MRKFSMKATTVGVVVATTAITAVSNPQRLSAAVGSMATGVMVARSTVVAGVTTDLGALDTARPDMVDITADAFSSGTMTKKARSRSAGLLLRLWQ